MKNEYRRKTAYLKCTTLVFMFSPMQFLMFTTTIECFMAASTALVCLNMAKGTNKLIGIDVTHDLAQLALISLIRAF